MKKFFLFFIYSFLFLSVFVFGNFCLANSLDLKTDKQNIIDYEQYKVKDEKTKQDIDIIKYKYTTNEVLQKTESIDGKMAIEDLSKRTSNSETFPLGNGRFKSYVYSGITYFADGDKWLQVETATTTLKVWNEQMDLTWWQKIKNKFIALAEDYFPSLNFTLRVIPGSAQNWATITTDATATNIDFESSDSGFIGYVYTSNSSNLFSELARTSFIFDTSIIGSGVVSEANFGIYGKSGSADNLSQSLALVKFTPDSYTSASLNDFNNYGNSEIASSQIDITSWQAENYNIFSINDFTSINGSGYTGLGLRFSGDLSGSIGWSSQVEVKAMGYYSANIGTDKDPYLEIIYTEAPPTPPIATSTPLFLNIEDIYYNGTSTTSTTTGITTISGVYTIPFILYFLILSTFTFTILLISFLLAILIKNKKR